jgi:hypothetical protein
VLALLSCIGVDTETASSGSPCTSVFTDLLLCGREGGGADVSGTPGDGPYTCQDACAQLFACAGRDDPARLAACEAECAQKLTPAQLTCLQAARCNGFAIEGCLAGERL